MGRLRTAMKLTRLQIALPVRNEPASGASGDGTSSALRQRAPEDTATTPRVSQDTPVPSVEISPSADLPGNDLHFQLVGRDTPDKTQQPLSMAEVNAALNDVEAGRDTRQGSLDPGKSLTPSRQRRRSRSRSTSFEVQTHKVNEEEPPLDAFNEPSFQDAFRGAKQAMKEIGTVLATSSFVQGPDSKMRELRTQAEKLAEFQYPTTRNVGFVGDSGVGKIQYS